MKIGNRLSNFIDDKNYKITILNNKINIINYIEIIEFSNDRIVIKYKDGRTNIIGSNLVVSRMLDNEILITGEINNIELR